MFTFLSLPEKIYILTVTAIFGAVMGSAMNCLAYRMVHEQKWASGRSVCPHCGHTLAVKDLVPVLSFLLLKGKCRYCGAKLEPRYFLTEAFLGLVYVTLVIRFGFTFDTVSALVLCTCLFALSLVDLDIQIIPNRFLLIPAAVRLAQLALAGQLPSGLLPALIFGGGLLVMSLVMDKVLKRESMGGGDIKLMALLGLFFSIPECLLLLILACVFGICIAAAMKAGSGKAFPFGPALSLAAYVTLLAGHPIVHWYLGLF